MAAPRKMKILMLHGFSQSAVSFSGKSKALQDAVVRGIPPCPLEGSVPGYDGVEFVYLDAPIKLAPEDIPGFRPERFDASSKSREWRSWWMWDREKNIIHHLDKTWATLRACLITQGPFDGVMGFSQGGTSAVIIASLMEPGRVDTFREAEGSAPYPQALLNDEGKPVHPPFKFVVLLSGFMFTMPLWHAIYRPRPTTPILSVLSDADQVIISDLGRVVNKVLRIPKDREVWHNGGHLVPAGETETTKIVDFVREIMSAPDVEQAAQTTLSKL